MSKYEIVQVKPFVFMSKHFRVTILFGSVVLHKNIYTTTQVMMCKTTSIIFLKHVYLNNNYFIRNHPQYRNIYKDKQ